MNALTDEVVELDPATGDVLSTFDVGRIPGAIAVNRETVWAANTRDRTVSRIDPETLDVTYVDVGGKPKALAATPDEVWVGVEAS